MPNKHRVTAFEFGIVVALFVVLNFGAACGLVLYVQDADERERERTDYVLCVQAKKNRDAIRGSVLAGDPTDLRPGQYGYSYAHSHPAEARAASEAIQAGATETLKRFPSITCPPPRP